jgi:hypothetical protein
MRRASGTPNPGGVAATAAGLRIAVSNGADAARTNVRAAGGIATRVAACIAAGCIAG